LDPSNDNKIVIAGPAYPLRGGIAAHNESLALHLEANGYPVSILSYKMQYPNLLFPGKTQFDSQPISDEKSSLVIQSQINSINPFNWVQTANLINQLSPGLLILRFWMPFFGMALGTIGKRVNRKATRIIGLVDNAIPHEPRPGDQMLTKYFTAACDGFMVMSSAVEADIRRFTTDKPIAMSPHPVYDHYGEKLDRQSACELLGIDPENQYMLFFGMIRKYKGLDLLLNSFALLKEKMPKLRLIIAGEYYEDEGKYKAMIQELGLTDQIINVNQYIPNDEVNRYFSAADIVTQTYHTATQSGITQIAYHFEKPMLVTDVGGLSEIVPHGEVGYVVEKEPEKIAAALEDFFTNERKQSFEMNVKAEARKYSWQYFVDNLIDLYKETKE